MLTTLRRYFRHKLGLGSETARPKRNRRGKILSRDLREIAHSHLNHFTALSNELTARVNARAELWWTTPDSRARIMELRELIGLAPIRLCDEALGRLKSEPGMERHALAIARAGNSGEIEYVMREVVRVADAVQNDGADGELSAAGAEEHGEIAGNGKDPESTQPGATSRCTDDEPVAIPVTMEQLKLMIRRQVKAERKSELSDDTLVNAFRLTGSLRKAAEFLTHETKTKYGKDRIRRAVKRAGGFEVIRERESSQSIQRKVSAYLRNKKRGTPKE